MQQGLMTRTGERQDAIEDLLTDMSQYAAEIELQALTKNDVARIAGQEAADIWPEHIVLEDIFDMLQIRVRGGSTGKPNKMKEREQWMQMLPEIQNTLKLVFDLQQAGNLSLAKSSIELLQETLERFDEYIDLDRFVPPELRDGSQMDATAQMMQQLQQCQQQLLELQQQNQELTQQLQEAEQKAAGTQQAAEVKMQQIKADMVVREDEINAKLTAEQQKSADKTAYERRKANDEQLQANRKLAQEKAIKDAEIAAKKEIQAIQISADNELEQARVKSEERIQVYKLLISQLVKPAGPSADGSGGMAQDGGKSEAVTQSVDDLHEGMETVLTGLQSTLQELSDSMRADSVPIRDAHGAIERVVKKIAPKASPKAKA